LSFLPLVVPASKRNTAKKPLKIAVAKGSIRLACWSLAKNSIIQLAVWPPKKLNFF